MLVNINPTSKFYKPETLNQVFRIEGLFVCFFKMEVTHTFQQKRINALGWWLRNGDWAKMQTALGSKPGAQYKTWEVF